MARVVAGARLHFGFQNLSLAHERLYGGVGVALDRPRVIVEATPAKTISCADSTVAEYAKRAADLLSVSGADITVEETVPRHVGLGSGTQLALATLAAVAAAHDRESRVRERAPALGRGGRSGVGVAGFEAGGFIVDAGHPAERFTSEPPAEGEWAVPPIVARHELPDEWRFVVALPDAPAGRSGNEEDESMRAAVEQADPGIAADLAQELAWRLLPAAAEGDPRAFGASVAAFGRRNGAWFADAQGGVYRPPAGAVVEHLSRSPAVAGAGQSSWGPAVYGVTTADRAEEATAAAESALEAAGSGGDVLLARPRNEGATVER